jgi:hypothetical protein
VSTVVRIFVSIAFLLFFAGGVYSLVSGRSGALGALLVAGLIFLLMVEVTFLLVLLWLPGVLAIAALAWRLLAPASGR